MTGETARDTVTASVHIDAPPDRVYEYFTRPEAIVSWMGDYALLEAQPGGRFDLDILGAPVRGRYLHLDRQGGAQQGGRPGEVLARPRVVVGADDRGRVLGAHETPSAGHLQAQACISY